MGLARHWYALALLALAVDLGATGAEGYFSEGRLPRSDLSGYVDFRKLGAFAPGACADALIDLKLRRKYGHLEDRYQAAREAVDTRTMVRACLLADLSADFARDLNIWTFFRNFSSCLFVVEFRTSQDAARARDALARLSLDGRFSYRTDGPVLVMGHGTLLDEFLKPPERAAGGAPAAEADRPSFAESDAFLAWTLSPEVRAAMAGKVAARFAGTPLQDALGGFQGFTAKAREDGGMGIVFESRFGTAEQAFQFKVNIMEGFFLGIMKMYLMQVAQKQLHLFETMKVRQQGSKAVFSCSVLPEEAALVMKAAAMVWENRRLQR